jgi:hypothetical protein
MDIPLPPELMDPDLSNTSDGTGAATVASVGIYANGLYTTLAGSDPGRDSAGGGSTRNSDNTTNASAPTDNLGDSTIVNSNISLPPSSPTPSLAKDLDLAKPTELRRLWKPLTTNPADFTAWTLLLSFVEQQVEKIAAFLILCKIARLCGEERKGISLGGKNCCFLGILLLIMISFLSTYHNNHYFDRSGYLT